MHVLLASALSLLNLKGSYTFFATIVGWYSVSYIYIFLKELREAPDFHPFLVLILASIQFVGFNGLSIYFKLLDGETLKFGTSTINHIIANGAFYVSLQHLLLYIGYCVADLYHVRHDDGEDNDTIFERIKKSEYPYYKIAVYTYLVVWILRTLNVFFPLASLGSLINNIAASGHLLSLYLLTFQMIKTHENRHVVRLHWLIVVVEIGIVLGMGMKELIIRNVFPYIILLFLQYKAHILSFNKSLIIKLSILLFFIVNVFIYISVFRDIANKKQTEWSQITVAEAFSGYIDYFQGEGIYSEAQSKEGKGMEYLLARAGTIGCNAWAINYAQTKSTKPDYLYYCSVGLIPRILWPDKPNLQVGGMMYKLATGHESSWNNPIEKNICSISIGFIGSCYFSLGFWGAIIIPLLMGVFLNYYWKVINKYLHESIVALWAFMALVNLYLKDCESFQDCGMVFVAWSCVYILILKVVHLKF